MEEEGGRGMCEWHGVQYMGYIQAQYILHSSYSYS